MKSKKRMNIQQLIYVCALVIFGVLSSESSFAQNPEASKKEMNKLSNWIGQWEGEGWEMDQSGQRNTFTVEENVAYKLNGLAIFVEGKGKNSDGQLGHNAVGLIYYDQEKKSFRFNSMTQEGMNSLSELVIQSNGDFVWGFDVPGGKVQFTITVTKNTWTEKGAYSDGNNWYPFLEMNLNRVK